MMLRIIALQPLVLLTQHAPWLDTRGEAACILCRTCSALSWHAPTHVPYSTSERHNDATRAIYTNALRAVSDVCWCMYMFMCLFMCVCFSLKAPLPASHILLQVWPQAFVRHIFFTDRCMFVTAVYDTSILKIVFHWSSPTNGLVLVVLVWRFEMERSFKFKPKVENVVILCLKLGLKSKS